MAVLQSRLDQLEMARQAQMNSQHTQSLTEISWGNQIRTYVLHVNALLPCNLHCKFPSDKKQIHSH